MKGYLAMLFFVVLVLAYLTPPSSPAEYSIPSPSDAEFARFVGGAGTHRETPLDVLLPPSLPRADADNIY